MNRSLTDRSPVVRSSAGASSIRTRTARVVAGLCIALSLAFPSARAALTNLTAEIDDGVGGTVSLADGQSAEIAAGRTTVRLATDAPVARLRLIGSGPDCPIGRQPDVSNGDDPSTDDDDGRPGIRDAVFRLSLSAGQRCTLTSHAWAENYRWIGGGTFTVTATAGTPPERPETPDSGVRHDVTRGTNRSSPMTVNDASTETLSHHGVRVYCTVSHLSYDDPIVYPGESGAAHLHLFWGNTGADAFTTAASLAADGRASCEGGRNNRSAYWAPALFDEGGQAVLPESVFVYYKSQGVGDGTELDRATIRPIPDGLQMIARRDMPGGGGGLRIERGPSGGIRIQVRFPECLRTEGGRAVLSGEGGNAHVAYQSPAFDGSAGHCPPSHPYRIPQVSYIINYAVPLESDWRLASDHHGMAKGESLHADYFASWDAETMRRIVDCNRNAYRSCGFVERADDGTSRFRDQLPERFAAPDGSIVYTGSATFAPGVDRTPFGTTLGPMAR